MVGINERVKEVFAPLYLSKKRYFLVTGGRASLKTSNVQEFIAKLTFEQGHGILFTRFTMTSAEKSIIPEFATAVKRLNLSSYFRFTKNKVTNTATGSFVLFSGIKTSSGDQTANLKSISGITTWVIEEGEDFTDERVFDTIDDSIRTSNKQNRVIWIQNPTTKEHFIYKRWIEPKNKKIKVHGYDVTVSDLPYVEHIHSTYTLAADLGFLSKGWLEKAKKYKEEAEHKDDLPKEHPEYKDKHESHYYYNYIGGWLERAFGVIYPSWREGEFDLSLPSACGLDLGYFPDPLALCRIAINKKKKWIHLQQLIYATELSNEQILRKCKELIRRRNELIAVDHNEPRLTAYLAKNKLNVIKAIKGKDSVINGIRDIQGYEIIATPDSNDAKKELNNYAWNDKKQSVPVDEFNHLLDAMRYAFGRLNQKRAGVRTK